MLVLEILKYELGDFDILILELLRFWYFPIELWALVHYIYIFVSLSQSCYWKNRLYHTECQVVTPWVLCDICVSSSFLTPIFYILVHNIFTSKQITTHRLNIICLCKMTYLFLCYRWDIRVLEKRVWRGCERRAGVCVVSRVMCFQHLFNWFFSVWKKSQLTA